MPTGLFEVGPVPPAAEEGDEGVLWRIAGAAVDRDAGDCRSRPRPPEVPVRRTLVAGQGPGAVAVIVVLVRELPQDLRPRSITLGIGFAVADIAAAGELVKANLDKYRLLHGSR